MTLHGFFAALVADPDALQLVAALVLWLPIAGGLFGVLIGEVLLDLLAWAVRLLPRWVRFPPPHEKHDYDICEHRRPQPSRAADSTQTARHPD